MKTITIQKNIYEFEELSKEAQEKALERIKKELKETEIELFLQEEMEEKAKELLQETFGDKARFKACYYSLSYCQGDGAMIEFDLETPAEVVKIRQHGYYYHEYSFSIDYYTDETAGKYEELKEKIIKMNQKLSKFGYDFIEYDLTLSDVLEHIRENGIEFLEDGTTYNGES